MGKDEWAKNTIALTLRVGRLKIFPYNSLKRASLYRKDGIWQHNLYSYNFYLIVPVFSNIIAHADDCSALSLLKAVFFRYSRVRNNVIEASILVLSARSSVAIFMSNKSSIYSLIGSTVFRHRDNKKDRYRIYIIRFAKEERSCISVIH